MVPLMDPRAPVPAPLLLHREPVRREWIDYNEHLNMAFYLLAFDHATDALFDYLGLGTDYVVSGGGTTFTLEGHITYAAEVGLGDRLRFHTYLFDFDDKRIHYAHEMYHDEQGYLAATNDLVSLHVSLESRRAAAMPPAVLERLGRIKAAHARLDRPPGLSRKMGLAHGANR